MAVHIALLRGINVGGHKIVPMKELAALFEGLGYDGVRTYVQSGNVVFRADSGDAEIHTRKIMAAIESKFGFSADVMLRTGAEMRSVIERLPFTNEEAPDPAKLLIIFLDRAPSPDEIAKAREAETGKEVLRYDGAELYIYFPDGQGRSKLSLEKIFRRLGVTGTGRNWNSVTKLDEMARAVDVA